MATILRSSAAVGIAVSALFGVLAPADASSASAPPPPRWVLQVKYAPTIDPASFVAKVNNRYFPLSSERHSIFGECATRPRRRTTWSSRIRSSACSGSLNGRA
jgi:hypothetical protein